MSPSLGLLPDSSLHHPDCAVRIATTDAEKQEIYRLRYRVYIEEMRGQLRHTEADNVQQQLSDEWDERAVHFYAVQGGEMAACARFNLRRNGPLECEEQFGVERFRPSFPASVSMTSRLVIHPSLRGSHLLKKLVCAIYQFALEQDVHYDFIDCNPQLLPLYSRLGYRTYRPGFNHSKYTYVIPMVLVLNDVGYLDWVKSPFVSVARRFSDAGAEPVSRSWDSGPLSKSTTLTDMDYADFAQPPGYRLLSLSETMANTELFESLTMDESKTLVSLGHIVSCRAGDSVLSPGDPGREIFVILRGSFQVERRLPGSSTNQVKLLKILSVGDTFGESRFLKDELRYISVKAREDSTLLIVNAKALDRLITTAPKMAAKVFRNLARIVTARLCDSVKFVRFCR